MHIYYLSNKYRDEINSLQIQISRTKVVPVPVSVPLSVPVLTVLWFFSVLFCSITALYARSQ